MEKTLEKDAPHVNGTDDDELDETATDIQSAIRGHLARKEALSKTQAVYKWYVFLRTIMHLVSTRALGIRLRMEVPGGIRLILQVMVVTCGA